MTTWNCFLLLLLLSSGTRSLRLQPNSVDTAPIKYINNATYPVDNANPSGLASIFSPRMDFDQWKPLTGRGDPLRNDPTYDYEPPVLERVHYWAEETRLEREHIPERKSEVLMLGVSSRKPSVTPRHPPPPPRRHQHLRPPPPKYEDFTYKLSDHYPMTILVPPPPPPPGHQPSLFILTDEKMPSLMSNIKMTEPPTLITKETTAAMNHLTSSYALQEANLIYQSSTTNQNWILNKNQTKPPIINNVVSSDYAGWGPTTPIDEIDGKNETHNLISNEYIEITKQPYSFYKSMLSEAPPPPKAMPSPLLLPTFVPTALPPLEPTEATSSLSQETWTTEMTTYELSTDSQDYYEEITTEKKTTPAFQPTPKPLRQDKPEMNIFDMLGPMLSMPLVNGPERDEDNLYAHASENTQVYKEQQPIDIINLESMQTMLPPPPTKVAESTLETQKSPYHVNSHILNSLQHKQPSLHTPDPYLHMRFTTTPPTTAVGVTEKSKATSEALTVPMYLIIQGHSKVKTYGSKPKAADDNETIINEISKHKETNEVKHLHPIKDKHGKKFDKIDFSRTSRAHNLKSLVDQGLGSIEIQEADIGIKYDVSDGSDVPVEIYRKGIVDSDENNYLSSNKTSRTKRQIDLEDLLPFDEDTIEEYVYNYFEGKKNDTSITGLIAQAVTSDAAAAIDDLDDDDDNEQEDEER